MFTRFKSWVVRNMPTREQMEHNRFIRPFAHRVLVSELWRFTRRSVPRGVALGMLVGILIPFAQVLFAVFFSVSVRANIPAAALTTFVTNPLTTPIIWALSYQVGRWMLHIDSMIAGSPIDRLLEVTNLGQFMQWLTDEGKVLALGLFVIAVVSASVSYLVSGLAWSTWVRARRNQSVASRRTN